VSQEEILKILANLGLKKAEAKIYFYLAKKGPKNANEIRKALKMTKQQLYPILKNLQNKAIVNATLNRPANFSAVPFEKALDLFAKAKFEEAKIIQQNRGKLLSDWQSITLPKDKDVSAKFAIIKGRNYVYSKIQQMIEETTTQFSVLSNFSGLLRAEQFGVLDVIQNHPLKSEIEFRLITEVSKNHLRVMKELLNSVDSSIMIKGRNADIGLPLFPRMVIRDNQEILYFISQQTREPEEQHDFVGILTNCSSLVKPFSALFEELWKNSTDIQQKILEIETGIPPQKTLIIEEPDVALAKYNQTLEKAKKDIIIVTSSEEILLYWKNPYLLKELTKNGVSIKIMAPISRENFKACLELSDFCKVRHVPNEYVKTIIVDGKHLFQFKIPESQEKDKIVGNAQQTFYSNDFEYVEKTKKMLLDIWKNSVIPSSLTVESVVDPSSFSESLIEKNSKHEFIDILYNTDQFYIKSRQTTISEQDVIRKIFDYKKNPRANPKFATLVGTVGHAIIHPHADFDFPDLLIVAYHIDEESALGAEDALIISLWLNFHNRFRYLPVAIVGDNPKASQQWKVSFENTDIPALNNYNLFKRDEIQMQVHGNTFFAGWTKPIQLLPNQKPLPPAALILEATGTVRPRALDTTLLNGVRHEQQFNYYDAFVTFIHQKTKYQGPATDGLLAREAYFDTIAP
jgi:sugar-specific transcriptional regulator TrmB